MRGGVEGEDVLARAEREGCPRNLAALGRKARTAGWTVAADTTARGVWRLTLSALLMTRDGVGNAELTAWWVSGRWDTGTFRVNGATTGQGLSYRTARELVLADARLVDAAGEAAGVTYLGRDVAHWQGVAAEEAARAADAGGRAGAVAARVDRLCSAGGSVPAWVVSCRDAVIAQRAIAARVSGRAAAAERRLEATPAGQARRVAEGAGRLRVLADTAGRAATAAERAAVDAEAEAECARAVAAAQERVDAWYAERIAGRPDVTAYEFARSVGMFEEPARAFAAWHAGQGRPGEGLGEAYDRYAIVRDGWPWAESTAAEVNDREFNQAMFAFGAAAADAALALGWDAQRRAYLAETAAHGAALDAAGTPRSINRGRDVAEKVWGLLVGGGAGSFRLDVPEDLAALDASPWAGTAARAAAAEVRRLFLVRHGLDVRRAQSTARHVSDKNRDAERRRRVSDAHLAALAAARAEGRSKDSAEQMAYEATRTWRAVVDAEAAAGTAAHDAALAEAERVTGLRLPLVPPQWRQRAHAARIAAEERHRAAAEAAGAPAAGPASRPAGSVGDPDVAGERQAEGDARPGVEVPGGRAGSDASAPEHTPLAGQVAAGPKAPAEPQELGRATTKARGVLAAAGWVPSPKGDRWDCAIVRDVLTRAGLPCGDFKGVDGWRVGPEGWDVMITRIQRGNPTPTRPRGRAGDRWDAALAACRAAIEDAGLPLVRANRHCLVVRVPVPEDLVVTARARTVGAIEEFTTEVTFDGWPGIGGTVKLLTPQTGGRLFLVKDHAGQQVKASHLSRKEATYGLAHWYGLPRPAAYVEDGPDSGEGGQRGRDGGPSGPAPAGGSPTGPTAPAEDGTPDTAAGSDGTRYTFGRRAADGRYPVVVDGAPAGHVWRYGTGRRTVWWAQGLDEKQATSHYTRDEAAGRLVALVDVRTAAAADVERKMRARTQVPDGWRLATWDAVGPGDVIRAPRRCLPVRDDDGPLYPEGWGEPVTLTGVTRLPNGSVLPRGSMGDAPAWSGIGVLLLTPKYAEVGVLIPADGSPADPGPSSQTPDFGRDKSDRTGVEEDAAPAAAAVPDAAAVAAEAAQLATDPDAAMDAARRGRPRGTSRLNGTMHAAHAEAAKAEQPGPLAAAAHPEGDLQTAHGPAARAIAHARAAQEKAGVEVTAARSSAVFERARCDAERAEDEQAERRRLEAEVEAQLRAETGYDEANRIKWYRDMNLAKEHVPALGLARQHVRALEAAESWQLVRTSQGGYQVRAHRDDTAGRTTAAARIEALREARYLNAVTESDDTVRMRLTRRGAQALYLVRLCPEGVHATERAAYAARWASAAGRSGMSMEQRKNAARRLPPLSTYAARRYDDRPVGLAELAHRAARAADVVSDPGAVDVWEGEGGACPGVELPRSAGAALGGDAAAAARRWYARADRNRSPLVPPCSPALVPSAVFAESAG